MLSAYNYQRAANNKETKMRVFSLRDMLMLAVFPAAVTSINELVCNDYFNILISGNAVPTLYFVLACINVAFLLQVNYYVKLKKEPWNLFMPAIYLTGTFLGYTTRFGTISSGEDPIRAALIGIATGGLLIAPQIGLLVISPSFIVAVWRRITNNYVKISKSQRSGNYVVWDKNGEYLQKMEHVKRSPSWGDRDFAAEWSTTELAVEVVEAFRLPYILIR